MKGVGAAVSMGSQLDVMKAVVMVHVLVVLTVFEEEQHWAA
jgi:hypothetical protein